MDPTVDLIDAGVRAAATQRLASLTRGRPVILGPGILAGYTDRVAVHTGRGSPVLVLATAQGAGPLPDERTCTVVEVTPPPTASMTEEVRSFDRLARTLPPDVVAAVEAFDPDRAAVWVADPFLVNDEPILGRPVLGGRPASWVALEDKTLADGLWDAVGVPRAEALVVDVDRDALQAASEQLATPLGVVWSGDARGGMNGGGNFVRWVQDRTDSSEAFAFFAPRCDRVRVQPFLDGVPCSVHGMVLPDGTAAFRPVELAILRQPARRGFVYGGLSTWWDPPTADREEMRAIVRRVGDHLATTHDYRGAFGVDGVLTVDGFRPTELNPRATAGVAHLGRGDPAFFTALQVALVAGTDPGLSVADVERLVSWMDAERQGRPSAVGQGMSVGGTHTIHLAWDGVRLRRSTEPTGTVLEAADTAVGCFAKVDPCLLLRPGDRLAPLNAALLAFLDAELGTRFGPTEPAPDVR